MFTYDCCLGLWVTDWLCQALVLGSAPGLGYELIGLLLASHWL